MTITEEMVEAAAKVIANSPGIDAPKLPFPCWMGLARAALTAALSKLPPAPDCQFVTDDVHKDTYPSQVAMKAAVELEVAACLGRVQTQTVGKIMQLFVDMDGVLADFDAGHEIAFGYRPDKAKDDVDWEAVRAIPNFYEDLPPMPDFRELWDFLKPFRPIILTGCPKRVPESADNKRAWARRNVGSFVQVRCCPSKDKRLALTKEGGLLIDDWEKYKHLWLTAGGRWITHTSAQETINQFVKDGYYDRFTAQAGMAGS